MEIIDLLIGTAVGAGCMIFKDKVLESPSSTLSNLQKELDSLSEENEKLRKRNKEAERHIEDIASENEKLKKKYKSSDEDRDDMEDELDAAKAKVTKLILKNDELMRKIEEYKIICQNLEDQIAEFKNK